MEFSKEQITEATLALNRARADLGYDLGGYSVVDLFLDQFPFLRGAESARELLKAVEANRN